MAAEPLTLDQLAQLSAELPAWSLREGRLHRAWRFADFSEAFGFIARVALEAERLNHHPQWSNSSNRVEIELTTHDCGALSGLDLELARRIDRLLG
jgi:4a-hydroxytetrahydrobiopterin dehydratase